MTTAATTAPTIAPVNKKTTRFLHDSGAMFDVLMQEGKNGISVFTRIRRKGAQTVLGQRSLFLSKNHVEAHAHYAKLVDEAKANGWTLNQSVGAGPRSSYSATPSPTNLPPAVPLTGRRGPAPKAAVAPAKGGKK
jgi:hypothetical protein